MKILAKLIKDNTLGGYEFALYKLGYYSEGGDSLLTTIRGELEDITRCFNGEWEILIIPLGGINRIAFYVDLIQKGD